MREIPVTEARAQLSDLVSQVAYGGEPVVLTRHAKPLVALVPVALLDAVAPARPEPTTDDVPVVLDLTTHRGEAPERSAIAAHHPRRD
jgi:prevent-host-death family protein